MPLLSPRESIEEMRVVAQLLREHEQHRRSVLSAFGWTPAVFPPIAAVTGLPLIGTRLILPLFALSAVSLLSIGLTGRGRIGYAFALLVVAGSIVAFDAHALQGVSTLALAYLPILLLVAATVLTRRVVILTTAFLLATVFATRAVLFDGFTLDWFSPTLDAASILVMTAVVVVVDRRRVERDRILLRRALLEAEQRHLREVELSKQLVISAKAASEANDAKTQFLLRVSHELRTPLNAILGYAELLAEDEEFPEIYRTDLSNIDRSGRSLLRLVDDVLDLTRIESGQIALKVETIGLDALTAPILDMYRPKIAAGCNVLVLEIAETSIAIDTGRTRQILGQLLSNAARFTSDGTITVRMRTVEEQLEMEIRDTGIGIARERLPHLFQPFVQAERDTAYKYGGTGLGLAIVDRLVRGMGGRIDVESAPGIGSCFRVILPTMT